MLCERALVDFEQQAHADSTLLFFLWASRKNSYKPVLQLELQKQQHVSDSTDDSIAFNDFNATTTTTMS